MIAIGSDHGGFALKEAVIKHLQERGIEYRDFGCYDEKSVDYPKYARAVAECVAAGEAEKGIVICCSETTTARLTREHNDANVLAMGGGMIGPKIADEIVDVFLDTPFSGLEKHRRRISQIEP